MYFTFFRFIAFSTHLDIYYVYTRGKRYESKNTETFLEKTEKVTDTRRQYAEFLKFLVVLKPEFAVLYDASSKAF